MESHTNAQRSSEHILNFSRSFSLPRPSSTINSSSHRVNNENSDEESKEDQNYENQQESENENCTEPEIQSSMTENVVNEEEEEVQEEDNENYEENEYDENNEENNNENEMNGDNPAIENNENYESNESEEYEEGDYPDTEGTNVITLYLSNNPEGNNIINPPTIKLEPINNLSKEDQTFARLKYSLKPSSRASSAPSRPISEIDIFKKSKEFYALESAATYASRLIQKPDNKFDLESVEGQSACKDYFKFLEEMSTRFKVACASREYRNKFSLAYKVLYKEGSLCYLTEILDSAQDGFPFLWVNGEKYVFSKDVLTSGKDLFLSFCKTRQGIRSIYSRWNNVD